MSLPPAARRRPCSWPLRTSSPRGASSPSHGRGTRTRRGTGWGAHLGDGGEGGVEGEPARRQQGGGRPARDPAAGLVPPPHPRGEVLAVAEVAHRDPAGGRLEDARPLHVPADAVELGPAV